MTPAHPFPLHWFAVCPVTADTVPASVQGVASFTYYSDPDVLGVSASYVSWYDSASRSIICCCGAITNGVLTVAFDCAGLIVSLLRHERDRLKHHGLGRCGGCGANRLRLFLRRELLVDCTQAE